MEVGVTGALAITRGSASVCLTTLRPQPVAARNVKSRKERHAMLLKDVRKVESIGAYGLKRSGLESEGWAEQSTPPVSNSTATCCSVKTRGTTKLAQCQPIATIN